MGTKHSSRDRTWVGAGAGAALTVFLAAAAFFLWTEHRAHLFGALPYFLMLLCLVMLLWIYRAHQGGSNGGQS